MAAKTKDLSQDEVNQRVAILKRFKELLKAQRDRFQAYLDVLDKQKDSIEKGTADDLLRHVELEEKIVADIFSIQKVIDPMEDLYRMARNTGEPGSSTAEKTASKENDDVLNIKTALEGLKTEAISRSERNKNLLTKRMAELRSEIKGLRASPYNRQRSAYAESGIPSLVDIRG